MYSSELENLPMKYHVLLSIRQTPAPCGTQWGESRIVSLGASWIVQRPIIVIRLLLLLCVLISATLRPISACAGSDVVE
jgi:hypothetical protein